MAWPRTTCGSWPSTALSGSRPGKDNRERPWRLTATSMSWRDSAATTEGAAAAAVFEEVLAERAAANLRAGCAGAVGLAGRVAAAHRRQPVHRLPHAGGTRRARAAIDALIRRYVDERPFDDVASRPKDSVPVDIYQIITVPLDQPPESS